VAIEDLLEEIPVFGTAFYADAMQEAGKDVAKSKTG